MKLSKIGRISMALVVSVAMGLGMTACGGGTIGYLWVLGTQYNQIAGFKIDDYTGNLTQIPHSPFTSAGTNPVSIAIKPGGRYVYVVNSGAGTVAGNVSQYTVGGDGVLTFEQTYQTAGSTPVWATVDASGSYLYVLDTLAPDGSGNGDISVFAIDPNTGRLSIQQNQLLKLSPNQTLATYFPVGPKPTMVRTAAGGCVYTLDSANNSIYAYSAGSGGQLVPVTSAVQPTPAARLTSINTAGSYIFMTDAQAVGSAGQILAYTGGGSGCALAAAGIGPVANLAGAVNPVYSLTSSNGKFLYVVNNPNLCTTCTGGISTISAFTILGGGQLQAISDTANPYSVGSGPVCMVQDPTSQYVYTSNGVSGTVTGKIINQNTGQLSNLQRGSSFTATGLATCLGVSGNVQ